MAWRVLTNGPMIEVSGGITGDDKREITSIIVGRAGQIIEKDLSRSMKERYDNNDPYVRSIVEFGELVPSDDDPDEKKFVARGTQKDGDEAPKTDDELVARNSALTDQVNELAARVTELENESAQKDAQIADLQQANEALTTERDDAVAQVGTLQADLEAATAPPEGGDVASDGEQSAADQSVQYDPTAHNVDDVLAYLATASPAEVARVKAVEAATDRKSTQIANFEPKGDASQG